MEKAFKGVWIPSELWMDRDLSLIEKTFLVQISSLDGEKGCYASNAYFSKFFNLSKTRCSSIIRILRDKGYIKIKLVYEEGKKSIKNRIININKTIIMKKVGKKEEEPKIVEVVKDAKTIKESEVVEYNKVDGLLTRDGSDNVENISETTVEIKESKVKNKKPKKQLYINIIEYLNNKCKTNYKNTSIKNQKLINARLREGFILEDFKKVINKKYEEWSNSDMVKYIRPETLFGEKFERYLNEVNMGFNSNAFNNLQNRSGQAYRNNYYDNVNNKWKSEDPDNKPSKWSQGENINNRGLTEEERKWAAENLL